MNKTRLKFTDRKKDFSHILEENNLNYILKKCQDAYESSLVEFNQQEFRKTMKDIRTNDEYLYDLHEGWMMEDILTTKMAKILLKKDIILQQNGSEITEEGRKISHGKITSKSDLVICKGNKKLHMEIQFSNKERVFYDIKETKIKNAKKENGLIFTFCLPLGEGFIADPKSDSFSFFQKTNNIGWGGKKSFRISHSDIHNIGGFMNLEKFCEIIWKKLK